MDTKKNNFLLNNSYLYLFVLFAFWYFLLGQKFIEEPFIWDDMHLIREYSREELLSVWYGSWDPDGIDTPSYRPIATLLYHAQGSLFGENVIIQKIFIFSLLYILMVLIIRLLEKLNFDKVEIFLITTLLIFSKIFTTLASWMTMSHLIFCYLLLFSCLINFLNWLERNKSIYLFFVFLFGISSILTREEVYFIPALIFFIGLYFTKFTKKNFVKIFSISCSFFALIIIHYYLRSIFTEGGPKIDSGNFKSYISHLLQSGMTSGWFSLNTTITIFQSVWLFLIFFVFLILLKNFDKINFFEKKNILILTLVSLVTSSPSLIASRSFGIFVPSVFSFALIIKIFFLYKKNLYSKNSKFVIMLLIFVGIIGGYLRSNEHLKSINKYSIYIIAWDTEFLFDKRHYEKSSVPEIRKNQKKLFLKNIGITRYMSLNELSDKVYKKEISSNIYIPNFHPLSPNYQPLLNPKEKVF